MLDFFDRQDQARKRTGVLLLWFGGAVFSILVAVYAAVKGLLFGAISQSGGAPRLDLVDPLTFSFTSALPLTAIGGASLYKVASLRDGGEAVARMLGGRPIGTQTSDPLERRALNVVEEMSIASGVPLPTVYVLDKEPGINAFAAGLTSGDAVVGLTRGTLEHLSRDELQGVVAHEFSHIFNGDMRMNLRLVGILHGILFLALFGRLLLQVRGGRKAGAIIGFGLALLAIGGIGLLFGRRIKSAVSRQREYLADASAVQFTRNRGCSLRRHWRES